MVMTASISFQNEPYVEKLALEYTFEHPANFDNVSYKCLTQYSLLKVNSTIGLHQLQMAVQISDDSRPL